MSLLTCPSRVELSALRLGELRDLAVQEIAEHLDTCHECLAYIETINDSADDLALSLRQPPSRDEFENEPEFRRALAVVEALGIGLPLPFGGAHAGLATADDEGLGTLREYQLLKALGQGGMGTVYKARHVKLKRIVALKVLPRGRTRDVGAIARFEREMEAVGKLEHPNIVRALDAGEHDGTYYLVMEYVDGIDLSNLVQCCGRLPIADACELVRQAAVGLQHAHDHGLVHRDIKPSNLVLNAAGQVKLLDLGLALLAASQPAGNELTAANQMIGTAEYIAPEQAVDSHAVDIRADIYSLGCTLYKLVTGEAPFSSPRYGTSMQKMLAHLGELVPPVAERRPDVSVALASVLGRMLAKRPADRYNTPAEAAAALAPFATGSDLATLARQARGVSPRLDSPVRSTPTGDYLSNSSTGTRPSERGARRRPPGRVLIAAAAAASLLILAGIVVIIQNRFGQPASTLYVPKGADLKVTQKGEELVSIKGRGDGSQPATTIDLAAGSTAAITIDDAEKQAGTQTATAPAGDLHAQVAGRIVRTAPMAKDSMVLAYLPKWNHGNVDNIGVANNHGGVRTLLAWQQPTPQEIARPNLRFLLAMYSRNTTLRDKPGSIEIHELLDPWDEMISWEKQPRHAQEPAARFAMTPAEGWKLFDVTSLVRKQAKQPTASEGVVLRFAEENREIDWSGYAFVSRESTDPTENHRPLLLVVEADDQDRMATPAEEPAGRQAATAPVGDLHAQVAGRIVRTAPMAKDSMVLAYLPKWNYGNVDNIGIANNNGGVRTLLAWQRPTPQEIAQPNLRFLLAMYSRDTKLHDKPGPIEIHELLEPWDEVISWEKQPRHAQEPAARFAMTAAEGWKLFDVTSLVRQQAKQPTASEGVVLRFADENCVNDWSGYKLISRESTGPTENYRPLLLVVEADGQDRTPTP